MSMGRPSLDVRELPVNRGTAERGERGIDRREWAAAEELLGGEGRRMRGLEDEMPRPIDQPLLLLGVVAPEHEDDRLGLVVDRADDGIGEVLPALVLVRVRLVGADR